MDLNEPTKSSIESNELVTDDVKKNDSSEVLKSSKELLDDTNDQQTLSTQTDSFEKNLTKEQDLSKEFISKSNLSDETTRIDNFTIDQTKPVTFSQTNKNQIIDDQSNQSQTHHPIIQSHNPLHLKQDKQIQLDPNELSNKLIDLKTDETKELSNSQLPDLVSSTEKQTELDLIKTNTVEEEIPSYQVKWIKFRNKECGIIMQNVNGCCPLLAIMNVLLLRGKIQLPLSTKLGRVF